MVSKKQTRQEKKEYDNNKNIKSINKVEISVGLDAILNNDDETDGKENTDIQNLKDSLSSYYEIDSKKINISLK